MGYKKRHDGPLKKKKKKLVIDFDENARKDYLTGFQKRRQQRKEKAQKDLNEKLKKQIKDERNKRRKVAKENMVSILKGAGLIDQEEEEELVNGSKKVVDFGSHEVIATSNIDLNDTGMVIGRSQPTSDVTVAKPDKKPDKKPAKHLSKSKHKKTVKKRGKKR